MLPDMPRAGIKRCTECRRWFAPMPSARGHQRVCGEERCREARRRKLARQRRAEALREHRADERERQQRCRARRAERGCHAPPSGAKPAELAAKLLESWDRAAALSRASLQRRIPTILRGLVPADGTGAAPSGAASRATLAP